VRRSLVAVYVHLVWATWDRLPLLDGAIERDVHRAIQAKVRDLGGEPLAVGGVEDHIHALVQLPATVSVAELAQGLKGASAHLVTHQLQPDEFFRWQGTYAAFSVSPRQLAKTKDYIARQREHHAIGGPAVRWEKAIFQKIGPAPQTFATPEPQPA
jgi:putative transposase